jgi:hypothetical protein
VYTSPSGSRAIVSLATSDGAASIHQLIDATTGTVVGFAPFASGQISGVAGWIDDDRTIAVAGGALGMLDMETGDFTGIGTGAAVDSIVDISAAGDGAGMLVHAGRTLYLESVDGGRAPVVLVDNCDIGAILRG